MTFIVFLIIFSFHIDQNEFAAKTNLPHKKSVQSVCFRFNKNNFFFKNISAQAEICHVIISRAEISEILRKRYEYFWS